MKFWFFFVSLLSVIQGLYTKFPDLCKQNFHLKHEILENFYSSKRGFQAAQKKIHADCVIPIYAVDLTENSLHSLKFVRKGHIHLFIQEHNHDGEISFSPASADVNYHVSAFAPIKSVLLENLWKALTTVPVVNVFEYELAMTFYDWGITPVVWMKHRIGVNHFMAFLRDDGPFVQAESGKFHEVNYLIEKNNFPPYEPFVMDRFYSSCG